MKKIIILFIALLFYISGYGLSAHNIMKTYEGIIVLTIPKSGTNLLKIILDEMFNVNIKTPSANYNDDEIMNCLFNNVPMIFHYHDKLYPIVHKYPKMKKILLIRDPRDIVISAVDYVDKHGISLWPSLNFIINEEAWRNLSRKDKIKLITSHFLINWSFDETMKVFNTFTDVYLVKFESLVNEKVCNVKELIRLCDFLQVNIPLEKLNQISQHSWGSKKSWTYNKGKIGRWKEEFDDELKEFFKNQLLGNKIIEWGYEKNKNW